VLSWSQPGKEQRVAPPQGTHQYFKKAGRRQLRLVSLKFLKLPQLLNFQFDSQTATPTMSPSSDPIIESAKNEFTTIALPADPDNGLSDAEKAEIVPPPLPLLVGDVQANRRTRTESWSGASICS
jgi:hypothetical protein